MSHDLLHSLRRLSDTELVARVSELARRERGATAELVAHLAELDTRDVHFRAGHGSLFAYCRDVLGLSEQEAYNRIAVARAARRFPVILEMLEGGAIHLTSVRLLAPHLTVDNHRRVLESAHGKSRMQVEEIAAALWPRPDAPSLVRKLPPRPVTTHAPAESCRDSQPSASPVSIPEPLPCSSPPPYGSPSGTLAAPASLSSPLSSLSPSPPLPARWPPSSSESSTSVPGGPSADSDRPASTPATSDVAPAPERRTADVTPLAPDRYRVQVTIGGDTLEKLRLAKDLLRHAVPSGDEAVILDRALTALLADLAQKRFAAAATPRPAGTTTTGSRHVPAEVKRKVWLRDLGRCAYVGATGRRCQERAFLEFHHVKPHALGGEATLENIQLRCRSHNAYEARLYFHPDNGNDGAGWVRETLTRYGGPARWSRRSPGAGNSFQDESLPARRLRAPP